MNNIISYHLVDHCNLNCSGCNHFSPLAQKRFADIDKFEKNLLRLNSLINITELNLMGGEPLLHHQINDFIKIARKVLDKAFISIWTNGVLLESMPLSFYESIEKYNITIRETNYGIIQNKFKYKNRLKYKTNYISYIKSSTVNCPFFKTIKNVPMQLNENGDLFFCCIPANIHHYNNYYKASFVIEKNKDYVNIFDKISFKNIFIKRIIERPFCYYCTKAKISNWEKFNGIDNWIK